MVCNEYAASRKLSTWAKMQVLLYILHSHQPLNAESHLTGNNSWAIAVISHVAFRPTNACCVEDRLAIDCRHNVKRAQNVFLVSLLLFFFFL